LGILYRPPAISIVVTTRAGAERAYRIIPAIAGEGFVLSPRIGDVRNYLALALGYPVHAEEIATARIVVSRLGAWAYEDTIEAELRFINVDQLRRAAADSPLRWEIDGQIPAQK